MMNILSCDFTFAISSKKQIKSKERVAEHGEVFTNEREVKAMCDLVKDESERIDSRVLEPACGDGNFLAEILNRKLTTVSRFYSKNPSDWEKYSIVALSSLYGIDIMEDNAKECRERLYKIWKEAHQKAVGKDACPDIDEAALYIVSTNSFDDEVRKKDGKYASSRKDGSGIGLSSIRITAEKYNGTARFSHDDKVFYIDVVMEV